MHQSNTSRAQTSRTWRLTGLVLALGLYGTLPACGEARPHFAEQDSDGKKDKGDAGSNKGLDPCATPNQGCPCDDPGEEYDCGLVYRQVGDYIACSHGKRTCSDDGLWGECVGDQLLETIALPDDDQL